MVVCARDLNLGTPDTNLRGEKTTGSRHLTLVITLEAKTERVGREREMDTVAAKLPSVWWKLGSKAVYQEGYFPILPSLSQPTFSVSFPQTMYF